MYELICCILSILPIAYATSLSVQHHISDVATAESLKYTTSNKQFDHASHASHAPQLRSCDYFVGFSSLTYPMINHTPLVASNLPVKSLVARRWPTMNYTIIAYSYQL